MSPDNNVAIENKLPRVDIRQKVTGSAKYAADQYRDNLIWARFIRIPYGKAKVVEGNVDKAKAIPGVLEVNFDKDTEGKMPGARCGNIVAESRDAIEDAIEALGLKFEHQQPATDADINRLYEGPRPDGKRDGFEDAAAVVEALYSTQVQTHSCLEPHGSMVDHRGDTVECWASTQAVHDYAGDLQKHVKVPAGKITVHSEYVGGGFGSKFGLGAEGNLAARVAEKYKRPVRVMLDRREEHLDAGNRPGSVQYMKLAAKQDGKIIGGKIHCASVGGFDRGGGGVHNPENSMYRFGDIDRSESGINLNFSMPRAFRAPGWPQGVYAMESIMDELALKLGLDPVAIRQVNDPSARRRKQRELGAELIGWKDRKPDGTWPGRIKRGYGCSSGMWPTWPSACKAECRISRDGTVEVRSAVQDIGTGTFTVVTDVSCKELQLDRSVVTGSVGNSTYPDGPGSGGSVVTRSVVPAVRDACRKALAEMKKIAAKQWNVSEGDVQYAAAKFSAGGKSAAWKDVCSTLKDPVLVVAGSDDKGIEGESDGKSDCVQFAIVDVDTETGIVRVRKVVAIHSSGEYVNRLTSENQICGGVIQGISYALFEDRRLDRNTGAMLNADFLNYKIAGPVDVPEIVPVLDQNASDTGTRPLGEPATVPTAGAIANAVANATGARVRSLPITPEKVLAELAQKGAKA